MINPIIPETHDWDTEPFFAAAREGKLVVKRCKDCGNGLHPPTPQCSYCGSHNTEWKHVSGEGCVYSWTVVEHTIHQAYPAPFTLVSVQVTDVPGVKLMARLPGRPALQRGMPMKVTFDKLEGGVVLPNWSTA